MAVEVMNYETMTDEQLAKRIANDKAELERRFAQQIKDQAARQKALMAEAISGSGSARKRGRRANAASA
jgi:hypothetical protein